MKTLDMLRRVIITEKVKLLLTLYRPLPKAIMDLKRKKMPDYACIMLV